MKVLIDSCFHGSLAPALIAAGYDAITVATLWVEDPGDDTILDRAHADGRIVVTRDKDFGELAVLRKRPHCGILQLWDTPTRDLFALCHSILTQHSETLLAGAIITASPYRLRIRPAFQIDEIA